MAEVLPREKLVAVVNALVGGCSIRLTEPLTVGDAFADRGVDYAQLIKTHEIESAGVRP